MSRLLALCLLIAGFVLPHRSIAAASWGTSIDANHDWRHEHIGNWNCQGISTLATGIEQPYYGRFKNDWSPDHSSVILRFREYHALGEPFKEEQQWTYDESTGMHTRTLVTNDGSSGFLRSYGSQANIMRWQGHFVIAQKSVHLSETLTRISAEEYQWYGELALGEQRLGYYRVTCSKISGLVREIAAWKKNPI
jgi:hypothetical protein